MRSAYKIIAHSIAGLVVVQAAAIALAFFGLLYWVGEDKHSLTPAMVNDQSVDFNGSIGFDIHSMGANLIALLAIVLLIISFFAKIPGGVKWAGFVFLAVLLQWALAFVSFGVPFVGLLHGANAIVVLSVALVAGRRASATTVTPTPTEATAAR